MATEHVGKFPCSYQEAAVAHTWDSTLNVLVQFPMGIALQRGKDLRGSRTPTPSWAEILRSITTLSQGYQQGTPPLSCALCFFNIVSFNLYNSLKKEVFFFPLCR